MNEEFNFSMAKEDENRYRGSDQRNEHKMEPTKQGKEEPRKVERPGPGHGQMWSSTLKKTNRR